MSKRVLIATLIATFLVISNYTIVLSQALDTVTISSSGSIGFISPLHTEGRYIKNSNNNVVVLRGFQKHGFEDEPEGKFYDANLNSYGNIFNEAVVRQNFQAMKSWGGNEVRLFFRADFWTNNPTGVTGTHFKDCIKRVIEIAAEEGIYVVLCGFSIYNGAGWHDLPWNNGFFSTIQGFANFWKGIASELKGYPNVLFELWNEVTGNQNEWCEGVNATIRAIREVANQIIIVQYNWDVWVRYNQHAGSYGLDSWVTDPRIQGSNIVFSTHMYQDARGIWKEDDVESFLWEYNDVKQAFIEESVQWLLNDFQKPLYIGEYGPWAVEPGMPKDNVWVSSENGLKILNEWGVSYNVMWWWPSNPSDGDYALYSSNFSPTSWGQIVQRVLP